MVFTAMHKRWLGLSLMFVVSVFSLSGCGQNNPYAAELSQFNPDVSTTSKSHAKNGWVVYVAPGRVTTGWLWFKKRNPVLYTEVVYQGTQSIKDVVVHFGNKTVTSPEEQQGDGLGFYLKTARLPPSVDITWQVNGQRRNVRIDNTSIVNLPWVN